MDRIRPRGDAKGNSIAHKDDKNAARQVSERADLLARMRERVNNVRTPQ
jgi:hypothetical protein